MIWSKIVDFGPLLPNLFAENLKSKKSINKNLIDFVNNWLSEIKNVIEFSLNWVFGRFWLEFEYFEWELFIRKIALLLFIGVNAVFVNLLFEWEFIQYCLEFIF